MIRVLKRIKNVFISLLVLFKNILRTYSRDLNNKRWIKENCGGRLQEIEIETLNRCNGKCAFCPVNATQPQREYKKMEDSLFYKIIDDLADMDFRGKISLFSNNEPFLDERIIEFHKYAYEKLPKAKHVLFTNGTLLDLPKFLEIIKWLDFMVIDNYNESDIVNEKLREVWEYIERSSELKVKVSFLMRKQNEVLTSRGGQAPNKKDAKGAREICLLPYRMMVVRPDGKISLCCNDALGKYVLGDLSKNTIEEVWNSKEYVDIRKSMLQNGRKKLMLCKNCDTLTEPGVFEKEDE